MKLSGLFTEINPQSVCLLIVSVCLEINLILQTTELQLQLYCPWWETRLAGRDSGTQTEVHKNNEIHKTWIHQVTTRKSISSPQNKEILFCRLQLVQQIQTWISFRLLWRKWRGQKGSDENTFFKQSSTCEILGNVMGGSKIDPEWWIIICLVASMVHTFSTLTKQRVQFMSQVQPTMTSKHQV